MQQNLETLDTKALVKGGIIAAVIALIVLTVAVLPAEYGIDPTGLGKATGFSRLYAPEAPGVVVPETFETTLRSVRADWRLVEFPIAERGGTFTRNGASDEIVLPLNVTNLTTVTARLEWVDDDRVDGETTQPDLFDVRITAPDRRSTPYTSGTNTEGGAGNATATLAWRSVPAPQWNESSGWTFPVLPTDTSGIGDWRFHVRLLRAGGTTADADDDPGDEWRLIVTVQRYELSVHESDGSLGDVVRLTLPAGSTIEYKFRMEPDAQLTYAWTSSAPIYWDLHAEATGAAADDTTSFATGTSTGESGTHTAPFAGRHGWFWHNRGSAPITITLETSGAYEIIGVP